MKIWSIIKLIKLKILIKIANGILNSGSENIEFVQKQSEFGIYSDP